MAREKFDWKKWLSFGAAVGAIEFIFITLVAVFVFPLRDLALSFTPFVEFSIVMGIFLFVLLVILNAVSWLVVGLVYFFLFRPFIKGLPPVQQLIIVAIALALLHFLASGGSLIVEAIIEIMSVVVVYYVTKWLGVKVPVVKSK